MKQLLGSSLSLIVFVCSVIANGTITQPANQAYFHLVGRCSFDPEMETLAQGDFRSGNAIASFYLATTAEGAHRMVVAEGISHVDGFITERLDKVSGRLRDQAADWQKYEVSVSRTGFPTQLTWATEEARNQRLHEPVLSKVGYSGQLGSVESYPATGSFVQNHVVNKPNAYPNCIFWEWL